MIVVTIILSVNTDMNVFYIPLIAAYVSQAVRLVIVMSVYYKYVNHRITENDDSVRLISGYFMLYH